MTGVGQRGLYPTSAPPAALGRARLAHSMSLLQATLSERPPALTHFTAFESQHGGHRSHLALHQGSPGFRHPQEGRSAATDAAFGVSLMEVQV